MPPGFLDMNSEYSRQGMFGGSPFNPATSLDFGGIPGISGPMAMVAQMFLGPQINQMMQGQGLMQMQFRPTTGAYDFLQNNNFLMQKQLAASKASEGDRKTYEKLFRSIANMTGTQIGAPQEQAISRMSDDLTKIIPFLVQLAPDTIDKLHGPAGSSAAMASYMGNASRYAADPVTGRTGMSGDTLGSMVNQMFKSMYSTPENMREMSGLGGARVGQLYDESLRLGILGSALAPDQRKRMIRMEAEKMGLDAPKEDDKLDDFLQGSAPLQEQIRASSSTETTKKLKDLSGVVSAMRDILGDAGHPNAPMAEIVSGIQLLTQGGLATMDKGTLDQTVRRMNYLAKNSGTTIDAIVQLQALGAAQTDKMGLNRAFAMQASEGSLAYSQAYAQVGGGQFSNINKASRERITQLDNQMRINAAGSQQNNVLGAIMALNDAGLINDKSPLRAYADAIESGQTTTADGKSIFMNPLEFERLATSKGGVSTETAMSLLQNPDATQPSSLKYRTLDLVRQAQSSEAVSLLGRDVGARLFGEAGIETNAEQLQLGKLLSQAYISSDTARGGTDEAKFSDPTQRNRAVAEAVWAQLTQEQKAKIGSIEKLTALSFNFGVQQSPMYQEGGPLQQFKNPEQLRQVLDPRTMAQAQKFADEQNINASLSSAFKGFNQHGGLQRLMEIVLDPEQDLSKASLTRVFGKVLGGEEIPQLSDEVLKKITEMHGKRAQLSRMKPGSPEYNNLNKEIMGIIGMLAPQIQQDLKNQNLDLNSPLDVSKFSEAQEGLGSTDPEELAKAFTGVQSLISTASSDERVTGNLTTDDLKQLEIVSSYKRDVARIVKEAGGLKNFSKLLKEPGDKGNAARNAMSVLQSSVADWTEQHAGIPKFVGATDEEQTTASEDYELEGIDSEKDEATFREEAVRKRRKEGQSRIQDIERSGVPSGLDKAMENVSRTGPMREMEPSINKLAQAAEALAKAQATGPGELKLAVRNMELKIIDKETGRIDFDISASPDAVHDVRMT